MRKNAAGGIWKYLDELGVLEKGTDEEIKTAKKAYWKKYFLQYKRKQRIRKPEYSIYFSKENGEYEKISQAAGKHNMTVTAFVHKASLAYLDNAYIVPDRTQVAHLEQLLADCLNEVKQLVSRRERFFWDKENKLHAIEKRIEKLQTQIHQVFCNPPLSLTQHDRQNQVV